MKVDVFSIDAAATYLSNFGYEDFDSVKSNIIDTLQYMQEKHILFHSQDGWSIQRDEYKDTYKITVTPQSSSSFLVNVSDLSWV